MEKFDIYKYEIEEIEREQRIRNILFSASMACFLTYVVTVFSFLK